MAKAKHYRKTNRRWLPLLLVLVVLAAVGVFVGAVLVQENTSYEGNILPDDVVLSERQWLFPKSMGGFLLLSTEDGTEQQTKATYLTQDCNVIEDQTYLTCSGAIKSVVATTETVYVAAYNTLDDGEQEAATIYSFPLNESQLPDTLDSISFLNDTFALETLSVDSDGTYYFLSKSKDSIQCLTPIGETWERVSLPDNIQLISGFSVHGKVAYLKGFEKDSAEEQSYQYDIVMTPTAAGMTASFENPIKIEAEYTFPLKFLSDTMVLSADEMIYENYGTTWYCTSGNVLFFHDAGLLGNGELAGLLDANTIGRFSRSNLTAPTHTYSYNGTICAMGVNGDVGAILHDGTHYRGVLLDDKAFGIGTEEPEPEASSSPEENSSSDTSAEAPSSSVESELPVSSTPVNSGVSSGSELEHPIQSGLDSSTVSSNVESNASSNTSSEEKEMLHQIISSKYSIDRGANLVVLPEGVTLAQFRKTVPLDGATLTAEQYNGGILSGGKLGTGMHLRLYNGWELVDEVVVVVKGDLNGNGVINSADEQLLFRHLAEETPLTEYFYTAADLNEDGSVNTLDLLLWKQHQY